MPPRQFQIHHGRKRQRQSDEDSDANPHMRAQETRNYNWSQRLILEQAAAILNVNVRDLPHGKDASQLTPNLDVSEILHVSPNELNPSFSLAGSEVGLEAPNLEVIGPSFMQTNIRATYSYDNPSDLSISQPAPISNGGETIGGDGRIESKSTFLWPSADLPPGLSESGLILNPIGSQHLQGTTNEQPLTVFGDSGLLSNFIEPQYSQAANSGQLYQTTSYGGVNGICFGSTGPFQLSADSGLGLRDSGALRDVFDGQQNLEESFFHNTQMGPFVPQDTGLISPSFDSGYRSIIGEWNFYLSPSSLSGASSGDITSESSLAQVRSTFDFPSDQDNRFLVNDFDPLGDLAFYDSLSSTTQIPTADAPSTSTRPWSEQPQPRVNDFDEFIMQNLHNEPSSFLPQYDTSLGVPEFWDSPLQSMSNDIAFPDSLHFRARSPITEQQLVLRDPSPLVFSGISDKLTANNRDGLLQKAAPLTRELEISSSEPTPSCHTVGLTLGEIITPRRGTAPNAALSKPHQGPRVRQAFRDLSKRKETAKTRKTGACVRCRMQRIRCSPTDDNVAGPCVTCARISGATLCNLPCVRYRITDSVLFDKGEHPQYRWSQRWSSWDIVEVDTWASNEVKTITVTQDVFGGATFKIQCREFIPVEGDSLARTWKKDGETVYYKRAPYAILNMKETAKEIRRFVASNVGTSISYYILEKKDRLLSKTYAMAYSMVFRSNDYANNEESKRLLQEVFQLWVAIRMESQPERIIGDETLGMEPQMFDPNVNSYGNNSIPPIMSAQVELMTTTRILQPLKKAVLERLERLIKANELRCWFSIYLCLFLLLHSCSVLTADEHKQARKQGLKTRYLYDTFVKELHTGSKTMIYYFHYCNKGSRPFTREWMTDENLALAELNPEQADFLKESVVLIQNRLSEFKRIRESDEFENDWYFVSQLYDSNWKPNFTV